jgi:hypothetical protein
MIDKRIIARKRVCMCGLLCIITAFILSFTDPPDVTITNGIISARILLADKENGYYRGSRFDWSGAIASLEWNGHSYFGQWFERYSPTRHDAILGPVEAFDPIGFENAKPGENFIKIGVGAVIKSDDSSYNILRSYTISNYGKWKWKANSNQVQFIHALKEENYGYEYKKTVTLVKDKPQLVISHSLKNTGKEKIETKVFNHNFFVIDSQSTGPGFAVAFPFQLPAMKGQPNEFVRFNGNEMLFVKELGRRNLSFRDLMNEGTADYQFKIENRHSGAGVQITGDHPVSKLVFWAANKTLCPEPYIDIEVEPGQEFTWKITYDFYTVGIDQTNK